MSRIKKLLFDAIDEDQEHDRNGQRMNQNEDGHAALKVS